MCFLRRNWLCVFLRELFCNCCILVVMLLVLGILGFCLVWDCWFVEFVKWLCMERCGNFVRIFWWKCLCNLM